MSDRTPRPKSWSDEPKPAPQPQAAPAYSVDHRLAWARLGRLAFSPSPPPLRQLLAEAGAILRHHALERCRGIVTAAAERLGTKGREAAREARDWTPTVAADVHAWVSPMVERELALRDGVVQLHVPPEAWPLLASPGLVRITVEPADV